MRRLSLDQKSRLEGFYALKLEAGQEAMRVLRIGPLPSDWGERCDGFANHRRQIALDSRGKIAVRFDSLTNVSNCELKVTLR
jgi:hypothetical protein